MKTRDVVIYGEAQETKNVSQGLGGYITQKPSASQIALSVYGIVYAVLELDVPKRKGSIK